jgi:hypothetical protein
MLARIRSGLTYANVMATIAVFFALGGGAYAALKLPSNSVGSKQIKANAVNSSKVANGSLLAGDFKAGQLPAGAQGVQGIQGLKGDKGDKGDTGNPGGQVAKLDYRRDNGSALETIFDSPGFRVQGVCQSGLTVQAKSKVDNGSIGFQGYSGPNAVNAMNTDFDAGQTLNLIATTTDPAMGTVTYASPTGQVTTISFTSALSSLGSGCAFSGTAVTT